MATEIAKPDPTGEFNHRYQLGDKLIVLPFELKFNRRLWHYYGGHEGANNEQRNKFLLWWRDRLLWGCQINNKFANLYEHHGEPHDHQPYTWFQWVDLEVLYTDYCRQGYLHTPEKTFKSLLRCYAGPCYFVNKRTEFINERTKGLEWVTPEQTLVVFGDRTACEEEFEMLRSVGFQRNSMQYRILQKRRLRNG